MAHFAELDKNNIVKRVIVVANKDCRTADGVEKESIGIAHCERIFGGRWIQTSYNANFRKRYAGKGMIYMPEYDHFAEIKPSNDHVYDPESGEWIIPDIEDNDITVNNAG